MIEVRGASQAFVASIVAVRNRTTLDAGTTNVISEIANEIIFWAADSEDEAYGKTMKAALKAFPRSEGWVFHHAKVHRIDDINWIGDK